MKTITTLNDAMRIVNDWTESYLNQPTDAQKRAAAGALVEYIGGYGNDASREAIKDFDLDAALKDAGY